MFKILMPLSDEVGMGMAVDMLYSSMTAKSHLKGQSFIQFDSMHKTQGTFTSAWESSPSRIKEGATFASGAMKVSYAAAMVQSLHAGSREPNGLGSPTEGTTQPQRGCKNARLRGCRNGGTRRLDAGRIHKIWSTRSPSCVCLPKGSGGLPVGLGRAVEIRKHRKGSCHASQSIADRNGSNKSSSGCCTIDR